MLYLDRYFKEMYDFQVLIMSTILLRNAQTVNSQTMAPQVVIPQVVVTQANPSKKNNVIIGQVGLSSI